MTPGGEDTTSALTDRVQQRGALRQRLICRREALETGIWQTESEAICRHVHAGMVAGGWWESGRIIGLYWPIRKEPDIRPLAALLRQSGMTVALPVTQTPDAPLTFRIWNTEDTLLPDRYGIPSPLTGEAVDPDVLILPGNAFDHAGYRLGYGAGFFDRTLAGLPRRPHTIGLCFSFALLPDVSPQEHDQPVDVVVTEMGWVDVRQP